MIVALDPDDMVTASMGYTDNTLPLTLTKQRCLVFDTVRIANPANPVTLALLDISTAIGSDTSYVRAVDAFMSADKLPMNE